MFKRFAFNWKAQTAHGLHSPFVFDLYTQVIDPIYHLKPMDVQDALIHGIGKHLKLAAGRIQIIDFGQLKASELPMIHKLMDDQEQILMCINIRKTEESLQYWAFMAGQAQAIHSIELFEMGIISLKPIAPKQHFYLKKS